MNGMIDRVLNNKQAWAVVQGDTREVLRQMPAESVHVIVTSPPYFGLRDYEIPASIWGGDSSCEHEWNAVLKAANNGSLRKEMANLESSKNKFSATRKPTLSAFCSKCGAWRGKLGLEPTLELYIDHMVEIFQEARRVLRSDGVLWMNLGDTFASWQWGGGSTIESSTRMRGLRNGNPGHHRRQGIFLKEKDLCMIPARVAIALQADGWYLRSDCIWEKCLSGGTWVYARTQKGDMPMMIKDLIRLRPGTVQLWNGNKWTLLKDIYKTKRDSTELELVLRSGERISCSTTHRFPTNRGLRVASELKVGDSLISCQLPEPDEPRDCVLDEDAAWFAGLYIAEGCRVRDKIQISGHKKEEDRWKRLQYIAKKFGGSATLRCLGNRQDIRLYGRFLNCIIDELVTGKTAKDKGIAPVAWRYSNHFLNALLDGYLSGDGSWDSENKRWRIGFTRNYNLERDLRIICSRLGYRLTLNLSHAKFQGKKWPSFKGEIRRSVSGHPNEKDRNEIIQIRKARCRDLYDIEVEDEPHLFSLASGILTHNSTAMPESVRDRPTRSHEYVFLLSKSEIYFYDHLGMMEPSSLFTHPRGNGVNPKAKIAGQNSRAYKDRDPKHRNKQNPSFSAAVREIVPFRNRRTVWRISSEPYKGPHYATYPTELPRICLLAAPHVKGCCPECGTPWERVVRRQFVEDWHPDQKLKNNGIARTKNTAKYTTRHPQSAGRRMFENFNSAREATGSHDHYFRPPETIGWRPTCSCYDALFLSQYPKARRARKRLQRDLSGLHRARLLGKDEWPRVPAVVMDLFNGSGTTGIPARRMGMRYLGIEMNPADVIRSVERIRGDASLLNGPDPEVEHADTSQVEQIKMFASEPEG